MTYALPLAAFTATIIAYYLITSIIGHFRFRAFAKSYGCLEPTDFSGSFPYGIREMTRIIKATSAKGDGEDILDDIVGEGCRAAPTFKVRVLDQSMLYMTVDPANIQAMVATQFKDFETGELRYHQLKPILGRSIFTSDGKFWEHSRAMFRPQFSRENINDLESEERSCNALIRAIGDSDSSGWTREVDVLPLLFNLTLDTATDFLFGESVNSQQAGIEARQELSSVDTAKNPGDAANISNSKQFVNDLQTLGRTLVIRTQLQGMYWLGDGFRFRAAVKRTRAFVEYFVERAIQASKSEQPKGKKYNLLSELVNQTQDRDELRNQTLAILFAGRDTTASLLGWAFARLALHPDIYKKLRDIILQDFPPGTDLSFSNLKSCRYLQHTLSEILRLHPSVPLNYRVAKHDTTLPVGGGPDAKSPVAIPKGASVIFSTFSLHRRADLWGEDVLEFKPERWEARIPAWNHLPFLGGPRICIGQQFAITEASYVIVKTLQTFDGMAPVDRAEMAKLKNQLGITLNPLGGVPVKLHRPAMP